MDIVIRKLGKRSFPLRVELFETIEKKRQKFLHGMPETLLESLDTRLNEVHLG